MATRLVNAGSRSAETDVCNRDDNEHDRQKYRCPEEQFLNAATYAEGALGLSEH